MFYLSKFVLVQCEYRDRYSGCSSYLGTSGGALGGPGGGGGCGGGGAWALLVGATECMM